MGSLGLLFWLLLVQSSWWMLGHPNARSLEEMEPTVRQSESSFRHQIILHEEKAHDNWLRARALLREMFVKDTKSHELRQSLLEETEKNNFLEECRIWKPMPGRYDMQKSPRRGPGAAPLWNGSSGRPVLTKAMDEGKDSGDTISPEIMCLWAEFLENRRRICHGRKQREIIRSCKQSCC
ncbi:transport and Golgi organization protein 1 homolog isoform X3 [Tamandua tetradactyla]|uniref:transport and Golgi organization protein 1 homolog isoform X3 n=1 Tax=Tamandua tetradactyla TaxID=48850 RepID=UPI00405401BD